MSMKTYREALEGALLSEMKARDELIVLRAGQESGLEESEYEVNLPLAGRSAFSIAWGAALAGLHPALDLRSQDDCGGLLLDALCELPADNLLGMTVIAGEVDADLLPELPGVLALLPKTPRQAAGFMRAALRSDKLTLLLADEVLYEAEDDVPDDDDFVMLPLDGWEEAETAESEAICEPVGSDKNGEISDTATQEADEELAMPIEEGNEPEPAEAAAEEEETVESEVICESAEEPAGSDAAGERPDTSAQEINEETETEEETEPVEGQKAIGAAAEDAEENASENGYTMAFCAARMLPCNLRALYALANDLEMTEGALIARCVARVAQKSMPFEWQYEAEAEAGECAFLPPKSGKISVWLGRDRITAAYDAEKVDFGEAARLLRALRRMLEKPTLLIYDREDEEK